MTITPDDIRNPPCGDACPFVRECLVCKFQPGHPTQKGGQQNA